MKSSNTYRTTLNIAGDTYLIRPAQETDFNVDLTYSKSIPDATQSSVNFGIKPNTDNLNLFGIYDVDDSRSNAFLAVKIEGAKPQNHKRVGFALYAMNRKFYSHEFYLSVDQSLRDSTLPAQLLTVIIQHAMAHGVKVLFCHADENNSAMQILAERTGMLVTLESGQSHGIKYTLTLDNCKEILQELAS